MTIERVRASLEGRKALVVGIANENSIAWGCAKWLRALGADLAVTYLNEKAKRFVEPLASELEAKIFMPLNVNESGQTEAVFERIGKDWGQLDVVVHSIAFSPKEALCGRVVDVGREGFAFSLRYVTPTSASSRCSACAQPQAIDWSLAIPVTSALRPFRDTGLWMFIMSASPQRGRADSPSTSSV